MQWWCMCCCFFVKLNGSIYKGILCCWLVLKHADYARGLIMVINEISRKFWHCFQQIWYSYCNKCFFSKMHRKWHSEEILHFILVETYFWVKLINHYGWIIHDTIGYRHYHTSGYMTVISTNSLYLDSVLENA